MATRAERVAEFTADREPRPGIAVELLCEDHNGTYVLPFPCRREKNAWLNIKTGEDVQVAVIGWRTWEEYHRARPRKTLPDDSATPIPADKPSSRNDD